MVESRHVVIGQVLLRLAQFVYLLLEPASCRRKLREAGISGV